MLFIQLALFSALLCTVSSLSTYIPRRFIIEYKDHDDLAKRSMFGDPTHAFIVSLGKRGIPAQSIRQYSTPKIFHGASILADQSLVSDDDTLSQLRNHPDVKNAWPVRRIKLDAKPQRHSPERVALTSDDHRGTPMANLNQSKGSRLSDSNINTFLPVGTSDDTLLDSYQNGLTFGDSGAQTAETFSGNGTTTGQFRYPRWNPHIITGVAALHDRGITGRGISVGIVDSGIYYLSEPLGGGVGSGYKVLGGYNLVGDIFSPDFQDQADFPANYDITDCNGHGTHIAGIIAGSESDNFVGVAPDANLRAYKVFGCSGSASDDTIIEAMLLAFQDRNDVISMSLGVDGVMFSGNPLAEVAARINEVGIFVAVSAGNTGNFGPFFGNGLGVGSQVTAVGASVSGQYIIYEAIARSSSGETFQFAFAPVGGLQPNTTGTFRLQLYNQAACSLAGSIPENVNNQPIALIFPQSSDCGDNQFYYSVSTLGYAVVFSYTRPAVQYTSSSVYPGPDHNMYDPIAIRGSVLGDLPEWAQSQISAGYTVDLVFQQSSMVPRTLFSQESLDQIQISRYTGMGPNYSGGLFPQIAAPGSNIYSTFLNDSFAVMTGTSMSTPYVSIYPRKKDKILTFLLDCWSCCTLSKLTAKESNIG